MLSNNRNVLVIDNDDDLNQALKKRLNSAGFGCVTATSGVQGLARFLDTGIDCIVSDLNMPGGDGVELAETIRRTSDVPIIFITGFRDDFKRRLRGIANVSTLRKPFQSQELIDLVAATLGEYAATPLPSNINPETA